MNCLIWLALALPVFVVAFGSTPAPDPRPALAEIVRLESELPSTGTTPDRVDALRKRIRDLAAKAVEGVDPAEVDLDRARLWGHLFVYADRAEQAVIAYERFLAKEPDPSDRFDVQLALVGLYASLGRGEPLRRTLLAIEPPTNLDRALVASVAAAHADAIADAVGEAVAAQTLDALGSRVAWNAFGTPSNATVPAEQRQTAEGYRVNLTLAKAELINRMGNRDGAIAELDQGLLAIHEGSAARRLLQTRRTQLSLIGSRVPELTVERTLGDFAGVRSMRGSVVVLAFFAHWCEPCVRSLRELKPLADDLGSQGLQVIGVTTFYGYFGQESAANRDMPKETEFARVGRLVGDIQVAWPTVFGPRDNFTAFAVSGIPHFVVVDRKGNIRQVQVGFSPRSTARLRRTVEDLLKEAL